MVNFVFTKFCFQLTLDEVASEADTLNVADNSSAAELDNIDLEIEKYKKGAEQLRNLLQEAIKNFEENGAKDDEDRAKVLLFFNFFSDISERNNDYSDILDFRGG